MAVTTVTCFTFNTYWKLWIRVSKKKKKEPPLSKNKLLCSNISGLGFLELRLDSGKFLMISLVKLLVQKCLTGPDTDVGA